MNSSGGANTNLALVLSYEDILLGNRDDFSITDIQREMPEAKVQDILYYFYTQLLGWGPSEARDFTTAELIKDLKLERVVAKVHFPPELSRSDLFYLSDIAFGIKNTPQKEHILNVYHRVLDGSLKRFPKNFFLEEYYLYTCLWDAINTNMTVRGIDELYRRFADKPAIDEMLKKAKLKATVDEVYELPIDLLHESLGEAQKNDLLYHVWRLHCVMYSLPRGKGIYENYIKEFQQPEGE